MYTFSIKINFRKYKSKIMKNNESLMKQLKKTNKTSKKQIKTIFCKYSYFNIINT